jgi:hypothetical protein
VVSLSVVVTHDVLQSVPDGHRQATVTHLAFHGGGRG